SPALPQAARLVLPVFPQTQAQCAVRGEGRLHDFLNRSVGAAVNDGLNPPLLLRRKMNRHGALLLIIIVFRVRKKPAQCNAKTEMTLCLPEAPGLIAYRRDSAAGAAPSPADGAPDTASPAWSTGPRSSYRGMVATGGPLQLAIGTFLRRFAACARRRSFSLRARSGAVRGFPGRRSAALLPPPGG